MDAAAAAAVICPIKEIDGENRLRSMTTLGANFRTLLNFL